MSVGPGNWVISVVLYEALEWEIIGGLKFYINILKDCRKEGDWGELAESFLLCVWCTKSEKVLNAWRFLFYVFWRALLKRKLRRSELSESHGASVTGSYLKERQFFISSWCVCCSHLAPVWWTTFIEKSVESVQYRYKYTKKQHFPLLNHTI